MENYGRWSLLGAVSLLSIGVFMLVKGVEPTWYSVVTITVVFVAAAAWLARYVVDIRKTAVHATAPASVDEDGV